MTKSMVVIRLRAYWTMIKSLQTGLLILTGVAGYISGCCLAWNTGSLLAVIGSLMLAISGSTILNMVIDRDIDAQMIRTSHRPLPMHQIQPLEAAIVGLLVSAAGVAWAFAIAARFGVIVLLGLVLDVIVYTIWLKRRTPYAILIGGLSGGMPALAGRVLATGTIDWIGVFLCLAILCWIPTHIMTFSIKYDADYRAAKVPTFPSMYGVVATRRTITFFSLLAASLMVVIAIQLGLTGSAFYVMIGLGLVLVALSVLTLIKPSTRLNMGLFKYASIYMLGSLLILIIQGF